MRFACPACGKEHSFPDESLPKEGVTVACVECGTHILLIPQDAVQNEAPANEAPQSAQSGDASLKNDPDEAFDAGLGVSDEADFDDDGDATAAFPVADAQDSVEDAPKEPEETKSRSAFLKFDHEKPFEAPKASFSDQFSLGGDSGGGGSFFKKLPGLKNVAESGFSFSKGSLKPASLQSHDHFELSSLSKKDREPASTPSMELRLFEQKGLAALVNGELSAMAPKDNAQSAKTVSADPDEESISLSEIAAVSESNGQKEEAISADPLDSEQIAQVSSVDPKEVSQIAQAGWEKSEGMTHLAQAGRAESEGSAEDAQAKREDPSDMDENAFADEEMSDVYYDPQMPLAEADRLEHQREEARKAMRKAKAELEGQGSDKPDDGKDSTASILKGAEDAVAAAMAAARSLTGTHSASFTSYSDLRRDALLKQKIAPEPEAPAAPEAAASPEPVVSEAPEAAAAPEPEATEAPADPETEAPKDAEPEIEAPTAEPESQPEPEGEGKAGAPERKLPRIVGFDDPKGEKESDPAPKEESDGQLKIDLQGSKAFRSGKLPRIVGFDDPNAYDEPESAAPAEPDAPKEDAATAAPADAQPKADPANQAEAASEEPESKPKRKRKPKPKVTEPEPVAEPAPPPKPFWEPTERWTFRDAAKAFALFRDVKALCVCTVIFWIAFTVLGLLQWGASALASLPPLALLCRLLGSADLMLAYTLVMAAFTSHFQKRIVDEEQVSFDEAGLWVKLNASRVMGLGAWWIAGYAGLMVGNYLLGLLGTLPFAGSLFWGLFSPVIALSFVLLGALVIFGLLGIPLALPSMYREDLDARQTLSSLWKLIRQKPLQIFGTLIGFSGSVLSVLLVWIVPIWFVGSSSGSSAANAGMGGDLYLLFKELPQGFFRRSVDLLVSPHFASATPDLSHSVGALLAGVGFCLPYALISSLLCALCAGVCNMLYCVVTSREKPKPAPAEDPAPQNGPSIIIR